jgi:SAM-dependent methyltransferase
MDQVTQRAQQMYDQYQYGDFAYGRDREKYYPLLLAAVDRVRPGEELWDIGCGSGFWAQTYLDRGVAQEHIHLVDLAPSAVAALRDRGFDARQGNAMALELEDNCSDVTICNGVIHHTPEPEAAFAELVRITRSGGTIYLAVYNQWHPHFYLVHRLGAPLRWMYWNVSKASIEPVIRPASWAINLGIRAVTGKPADRETLRTKFMDEVITPRAHLFSRPAIRRLAERHGARVETMEYFVGYTMITALIRVK